MQFASDMLHSYVQDRVAASKAWASIQVFVSDVTVPGEGEHKIMDFIRYLRSLNDYNPNMQHCIYGADADLFMLTLGTHEPRFTILREATEEIQCSRCLKLGHHRFECRSKKAAMTPEGNPLFISFSS